MHAAVLFMGTIDNRLAYRIAYPEGKEYGNGCLLDDCVNRSALCLFKSNCEEYLSGLLESGSDE